MLSSRFLLQLLRHCCKSVNHVNQVHALLATTGLLAAPGPASCSSSAAIFHNSLIRAHGALHSHGSVIPLFNRMLCLEVPPNAHTFPSLIQAAATYCPSVAKSLHAQVVARGFSADPVVGTCLLVFYGGIGELACALRVFDEICEPDVASFNSMLDALCKNGKAESALAVFERMPERDVVSWTSMINGFGRNKRFNEAICLFKDMIEKGGEPHEATLVSVLSCVANSDGGVVALDQGKQIHGYIIRSDINLTDFLGTALIHCYGKSSNVPYARNVFTETPRREVCIWNAMISSLASNGLEQDALDVFELMRREGLQPNSITYVGVLTACSRAGLVDLGLMWFRRMQDEYSIVPTTEHYGCMVDMLGRSGRVKEAAEFVRLMPEEADPSVWGALLDACRIHGEVELGEDVGKRLMELQPCHSGRYVVFSNLYARAGRWGEAAEMREAMGKAGVRKIVGVSRTLL